MAFLLNRGMAFGRRRHYAPYLARPYRCFALSGYLVAGSLERSKTILTFIGLRVIRIYPALAVKVALSALLIGTAVTNASFGRLFSRPAVLEISPQCNWAYPLFSARRFRKQSMAGDGKCATLDRSCRAFLLCGFDCISALWGRSTQDLDPPCGVRFGTYAPYQALAQVPLARSTPY